MKSEVLNRFDMPHLMIIALGIFVTVFALYTWWTLKPSNKKFYDEASQIPFNDDGAKL